MTKVAKPGALVAGGAVRVVSPASASDRNAFGRGVEELERLQYRVRLASPEMHADGYFAGPLAKRAAELQAALLDDENQAIMAPRGGYGTGPVLDLLSFPRAPRAKLVVGYSDLTMLHAYLWRRWRWVTLYGPMVAAGFDKGADRPGGYDRVAWLIASSGERRRWELGLGGEALFRGQATGIVLGGCLTLLQATIGTPWEFDARGAILLLEDVGVKPYQVDRMLVHLAQAGKLRGVRGIILGEFPDSSPVGSSTVTVRDVCRRLLAPLRVPVVYGAAIGHTARAIVTVPLGVRARLTAGGEGKLEILESAVVPPAKATK
jgi:muramoyltetrapeptide carboxypeptidase